MPTAPPSDCGVIFGTRQGWEDNVDFADATSQEPPAVLAELEDKYAASEHITRLTERVWARARPVRSGPRRAGCLGQRVAVRISHGRARRPVGLR